MASSPRPTKICNVGTVAREKKKGASEGSLCGGGSLERDHFKDAVLRLIPYFTARNVDARLENGRRAARAFEASS
jgi:hypothetical protein